MLVLGEFKACLICSCKSGSTASTAIEALCSKMAQQSGVAKVRMSPQRPICSGALMRGWRRSTPRCSSLFMTRGMRTCTNVGVGACYLKIVAAS